VAGDGNQTRWGYWGTLAGNGEQRVCPT